jgi:hypothetical protein
MRHISVIIKNNPGIITEIAKFIERLPQIVLEYAL